MDTINTLVYTQFTLWDLLISFTPNKIINTRFLPKGSATFYNNLLNNESSNFAMTIFRELDAYLNNGKHKFNLNYETKGTLHQQKVWAELIKIPSGQSKSYKEIGEAIQSHPRAVGNACGLNPIPLFIPCHRIIGTNKKIGGFMQGRGKFELSIKKWLLNHEEVII